jgi:hypothetical protein
MATFVETMARGFDRGERRRLGGFFGAIVVLHVIGLGCLLLGAMVQVGEPAAERAD